MMNIQSRVNIIFFILLTFLEYQAVLGQIGLPEKSNSNVFDPSRPIPSAIVISAIEENNLNIQITFREPDSYTIKFRCAEEKCLEVIPSASNRGSVPKQKYNISFRDLNNDFNNLRQIILNGFENTPSNPLTLEVPDGAIVLTFKKSQYATKVRIGYKSFDYTKRAKYFPEHYSDWLDKSQIYYLFRR